MDNFFIVRLWKHLTDEGTLASPDVEAVLTYQEKQRPACRLMVPHIMRECGIARVDIATVEYGSGPAAGLVWAFPDVSIEGVSDGRQV